MTIIMPTISPFAPHPDSDCYSTDGSATASISHPSTSIASRGQWEAEFREWEEGRKNSSILPDLQQQLEKVFLGVKLVMLLSTPPPPPPQPTHRTTPTYHTQY